METQKLLQCLLIEAMTNILEKDKTISKAEAESILLMSQSLEIIAALPPQPITSQIDTAAIRAIPANSVQPG